MGAQPARRYRRGQHEWSRRTWLSRSFAAPSMRSPGMCSRTYVANVRSPETRIVRPAPTIVQLWSREDQRTRLTELHGIEVWAPHAVRRSSAPWVTGVRGEHVGETYRHAHQEPVVHSETRPGARSGRTTAGTPGDDRGDRAGARGRHGSQPVIRPFRPQAQDGLVPAWVTCAGAGSSLTRTTSATSPPGPVTTRSKQVVPPSRS